MTRNLQKTIGKLIIGTFFRTELHKRNKAMSSLIPNG